MVDGYQIMHNGLRIKPGSYNGLPVRIMLEKNRGVHEPQEECIFGEVLKHVPPGGVMVELGCYWAFYSMWFMKEVPGAACYLVEPEAKHLEYGRENFAANGMQGTVLWGFVSDRSREPDGGPGTICVDDLVRDHRLERIDVLHSDIQGFEPRHAPRSVP